MQIIIIGKSFETLTCDEKIYVTAASSVTVFAMAMSLFFITGFLCGQKWKKKAAVTVSSESEISKEQTPYYDDIVLKTCTPSQNMKLKANVAYGHTGTK